MTRLPAESARSDSEPAAGDWKRADTRILIVLACVLVWLVQDSGISSLARIIVIGLLLLGLVRWTAALLLVLFQLHLYFGTAYGSTLSNSPVMVQAVLVTLMSLSRLRSCQELTGVESVAALLMSAVGRAAARSATSESEDEERSGGPRVAWRGELLWMAVVGMILTGTAGMVLQWFPERPESVGLYGLTPSGLRAIQIGLLLFAVWLPVSLVVSEGHWKHLRPRQARLWLRSRLLEQHHRELKAIERRREEGMRTVSDSM